VKNTTASSSGSGFSDARFEKNESTALKKESNESPMLATGGADTPGKLRARTAGGRIAYSLGHGVERRDAR
jgi:hypothetical protein